MREFPALQLRQLRGWVNGVLVDLPRSLAREAREEGPPVEPPQGGRRRAKESATWRRILKHAIGELVGDLRKTGEDALANQVAAARTLGKKARLLKAFYDEQVAPFGEPEDRLYARRKSRRRSRDSSTPSVLRGEG